MAPLQRMPEADADGFFNYHQDDSHVGLGNVAIFLLRLPAHALY